MYFFGSFSLYKHCKTNKLIVHFKIGVNIVFNEELVLKNNNYQNLNYLSRKKK